MKRLLLWGGIGFAVLVVIILIVTLISRGRKSGGGTSANQPVTLTFWDPIDAPDIFKEIIKNYEIDNPGVKITYVNKPLKDYEIESTNALSAGRGPDIWAIPNSSILRHLDKLSASPDGFFKKSKNDKTTNIEGLKQRFVPIVAQENSKDDKLYGVPLFVDTLVLYYNPGLIRARARELTKAEAKFDEGLFDSGPRTWNDLVELVKSYSASTNGSLSRPGIALGTSQNVTQAQDILATLMIQNGATMASPDGLTATFNLPSKKQINENFSPGTKALEFYTSFSNPGSATYSWDESQPTSYQAFRDGQVPMMIDYSNATHDLKQENPNLNFRLLPLPQISGETKAVDFAKYWTLTVPKTSPQTQAAWSFIRYLQGTGLTTYLSTSGRPSPLIPTDPPQTVLGRLDEANPYRFQTLSAVSWYRGKDPDKIETIFKDMIDKVVAQHISAQNAIDQAATRVSEVYRTREGLSTAPTPTPQKAE